MIRALRNIDRLYFGPSVGGGSAFVAAVMLLTGVTPWAFAWRYWRGDFADEVERLCK